MIIEFLEQVLINLNMFKMTWPMAFAIVGIIWAVLWAIVNILK